MLVMSDEEFVAVGRAIDELSAWQRKSGWRRLLDIWRGAPPPRDVTWYESSRYWAEVRRRQNVYVRSLMHYAGLSRQS